METRPIFRKHIILKYLQVHIDYFKCRRIANSIIKGQLISKANFKVFISTKKPKKIFMYFCSSFIKPIKVVETKDKSTKRLI